MILHGDGQVPIKFCPHCGRELVAPTQPSLGRSDAPAVETVSIRPVYQFSPYPPAKDIALGPLKMGADPDAPRVYGPDTVRLPSVYQPDDSPKVQDKPVGYEVIEVEPKAGWSPRTDLEEGEVRRILSDAKKQLVRRKQIRRPEWPLEKNGFHCLAYPLRVFWSLFCMAIAWAILMPIFLLFVPTPDTSDVFYWFARVPGALFPLVLMGVSWSFLRQVLRLGLDGDRGPAPWLFDFEFRTILRSGIMFVLTFLAGPIFLAIGAVWFLVHAGTLGTFDRVLIWQLVLAGGVLWAFLLATADAEDSFSAIHLSAVVRQIRLQGWPAVFFPVVGGLSLGTFCYLWIRIWATAGPRDGGGSWMLHVLLGIAALLYWTFLLRWYGIQRYWRRRNGLELRPEEAELVDADTPRGADILPAP